MSRHPGPVDAPSRAVAQFPDSRNRGGCKIALASLMVRGASAQPARRKTGVSAAGEEDALVRASDRMNREMTFTTGSWKREWVKLVLLSALAVLPNLRAQTASPPTDANSQLPSDLQQALLI